MWTDITINYNWNRGQCTWDKLGSSCTLCRELCWSNSTQPRLFLWMMDTCSVHWRTVPFTAIPSNVPLWRKFPTEMERCSLLPYGECPSNITSLTQIEGLLLRVRTTASIPVRIVRQFIHKNVFCIFMVFFNASFPLSEIHFLLFLPLWHRILIRLGSESVRE